MSFVVSWAWVEKLLLHLGQLALTWLVNASVLMMRLLVVPTVKQ
jgi:hypothetical protein